MSNLWLHLQSPAWAAVRMALTLRRTASVTPCASITRAAALIMRPPVAWIVSCFSTGVLVIHSVMFYPVEIKLEETCLSHWYYHTFSSARGDTFVFAEDDDDFLDSSPTPAAGRQLNDESLPVSHHRPTPPHRFTPVSSSKPRKLPSTKPEITTATEAPETITQTVPITQIVPTAESATKTPISQDPIKVPVTQAAPVTTTAPPTTATTAAPDPDAETCSGRPFDSFMQLKNGSIYAFRGKWSQENGVNILYSALKIWHLTKSKLMVPRLLLCGLIVAFDVVAQIILYDVEDCYGSIWSLLQGNVPLKVPLCVS